MNNSYEQAKQVYRRLIQFIAQKQNKELRLEGTLDLSLLYSLAAETVEQVLRSPALVKFAVQYYDIEDLTISHAANVTILALKVAMGLNYTREQLVDLAAASLIHDIGAGLVPLDIINKDPKALTPKEIKAFEHHSHLGYEVVRKINPQYEHIAQVIWQHHEKGDGKGYPLHLKENQILPDALLISMVDTYEALIHPRTHRDALVPPCGINEILLQKGRAFPMRYIKALIEQISIYPIGCWGELNNGDIGEVIETRRENPVRPLVRVYTDRTRSQELNEVIDLKSNYLINIVKCIPPLKPIKLD